MGLRLPDRAAATVGELNTYLQDLVLQLEPRVSVDRDVGTSETQLFHGQKGAPRMVKITPHTQAIVWMSSPSDDKYVYLTADVACVCDLEFVP